jgi:hypothetical protein
VVEIDPRVEAAARQFFKLPDDPTRIAIRHGDGADFMVKTRQRFDLILVDGFDADARPGQLDTLPFYLDCRARLADDGLLCVNLLSRRKDFGKSVKRLEEAFDGPRHRLSLLRQRQCHRAVPRWRRRYALAGRTEGRRHAPETGNRPQPVADPGAPGQIAPPRRRPPEPVSAR